MALPSKLTRNEDRDSYASFGVNSLDHHTSWLLSRFETTQSLINIGLVPTRRSVCPLRMSEIDWTGRILQHTCVYRSLVSVDGFLRTVSPCPHTYL